MRKYKLEITRPYSYEIQLKVLKNVLGLFWTTETCWKVTSLTSYGEETKLIKETVDMIEKFKSMYGLEEQDIIGSPHAQKVS